MNLNSFLRFVVAYIRKTYPHMTSHKLRQESGPCALKINASNLERLKAWVALPPAAQAANHDSASEVENQSSVGPSSGTPSI